MTKLKRHQSSALNLEIELADEEFSHFTSVGFAMINDFSIVLEAAAK